MDNLEVPRILVLMSTYNGERYVEEQIISILKQKNVIVEILIRDDGSSDGTMNILNKFKCETITVIQGDNIGSTQSFFELINLCDDKYDYFAFSDQDDYWDEDKLYVAVKYLSCFNNRPGIYSCNARLVDENLNLIYEEKQTPKVNLGSAFVKNYVTGCTAVMNNLLIRKLKGRLNNLSVFSHEWWINLVCLSLDGVSLFDVNCHINYRQHSRNVVGAPINLKSKWISRFKKFYTNKYNRDIMAKEILKKYKNELSKETIEFLTKITMLKYTRARIIFDNRLRTKSTLDNICFWLLVIFRRA